MRRSLPWLIAFVGSAVVLQAACASLSFDGPGGTSSSSPSPTITSTPPDLGDGGDGPFVGSGNGIFVVNTCVQLASVTGNVATTASSSPFQVGRRALLIQVQGFTSMLGTTAQIADPGTVGRFEVRTIVPDGPGPVFFGEVTLASALTYAYSSDATHRAQICTIPQFTDVTISAPSALSAPAWNGSSGGIVAFYASGTFRDDSNVGVAGGGFRGGTSVSANCNATDVTDLDVASADKGGAKGEGIDLAFAGQHGRGNYANGGGGGNACNAGGGGGGNGGIGGYGGYEYSVDPMDPLTMGLPGAPIASAPERLLFGGAGAAGHSNSGTGSSGGAGGGALFITAGTLAGTGIIGAIGRSAVGGCQADGCGGGGAGGSIVLRVAGSSTFSGKLLAGGGNGSTMGGVVGDEYGPGGGGGGGRVWIEGIGTSGFSVNLAGGANGTTPDNGAWGATPGGDGVIQLLP